jgi:dihydroflavonol-4-reductase
MAAAGKRPFYHSAVGDPAARGAPYHHPAMPKTLVTGGAGFIGTHLVRALLERGDDVRLLVRRSTRAGHLEGLDVERATGDVTDRRAVRRALIGIERVFHVAGRTSMRRKDRDAVFATNVGGTRIVMQEALNAGVERVVHTSSVSAIGAARPRGAIDETSRFEIGHLGIAYVNSKHEAEHEALRVAARGLDVVFVNPTFVLGPDDPTRTSMGLIRRFLLGQIPVYVDGGLNVVDVRDVAAGHLLADAKGRSGERYILGGRNFTLDRLFADLARISGISPPGTKLPVATVLAGIELAERLRLPVGASRDEVRGAALWWTARSTKAKTELGFKSRPHEETLDEALQWQMDELGHRVHSGRRGVGAAAIGALGRIAAVGDRLVRS